ncbi:MAG: hypothetical protein MZW92_79090 [Comamonadaceae bacterium]|nr:hypothetical protein [Comamonadaceae bacterium]
MQTLYLHRRRWRRWSARSSPACSAARSAARGAHCGDHRSACWSSLRRLGRRAAATCWPATRFNGTVYTWTGGRRPEARGRLPDRPR